MIAATSVTPMHDLVTLGAAICNTSTQKTRSLVDTLLALPAPGEVFQPGGGSGLNNDGSPLQFCISTKKDGWSARYISDPAHVMGVPAQRFIKSCEALEKLYDLTGTSALKSFCDDMFAFHLPKNRHDLSEYPDGILWLGAPVAAPGIAVYMDGRRGGNEEGWQRFRLWLTTLMPGIDKKELNTLIDTLTVNANIMSIGFEGSNFKNLRVKVYWRLHQPALLDSLGYSLLEDDHFKTFLGELVQDKAIKLSGFVFSTSFHLATQQLFDTKIDVCACKDCLHLDAAAWMERLQYFTREYQLADFPLTGELSANKCAVSFFGSGLDISGNKRLNLYLKTSAGNNKA